MSAAKKAALFATLLLAAVAPAGAQEAGARLTVAVTGADPSVGQVLAQLFADEAGYMRVPHAQARADVDADGRAVLQFGDLAAGDYAISVVYDRDGDGELDAGLFGIPRERVGFSNDARGRFGPASWEAARFEIGAEGAEIAIALRRPGR